MCAAALSVLSLAVTRIAAADVAAGLTRAAEAAQPLARAVRAVAPAPSRPWSRQPSLRRPLSLDVSQPRVFGLPQLPSAGSLAAEETRFAAAFPIRWQKDEPQVFRTARAFRHQGLPLVHLWKSDSGEHMLSIGLNSHGVPGIWLTQKVPD